MDSIADSAEAGLRGIDAGHESDLRVPDSFAMYRYAPGLLTMPIW